MGVCAAANAIRLAIYYGTKEKFEGFFAIEGCSAFFGGAIFVMAIIVNGVFADFKESERVHGEVAVFLENIFETIEYSATVKGYDSRPQLRNLQLLTRRIFVFLRDVEQTAVTDHFWVEMTLLVKAICYPIDQAGLGAAHMRLWSYGTDHIRQRLMRIERIAQTSFIATGYTLFDICVLAVIVMTVLAKYSGGLGQTHLTITAVTMLFTYVSMLARDVDDPFDYTAADLDPDNIHRMYIVYAGRTEVDPRPLLAFYRRLTDWLKALEANEVVRGIKDRSELALTGDERAALARLPSLGATALGRDIRQRFINQASEGSNVFDGTDMASSPSLGASSRVIEGVGLTITHVSPRVVAPEDFTVDPVTRVSA